MIYLVKKARLLGIYIYINTYYIYINTYYNIYIYMYIYTVDGRNPASPWMVETL